MPQRDKLRVKIFLDDINQNEKAIIFCADQQHALEIRNLINQMAGSSDVNYCVRVTADEGKRGKQKLVEFRDNERRIPTILTSSRMLSTGVDARNVRHIVLMRPIKSMIEFKQIIGRGTRIFDGKNYFTIHDFVKAHRKFNDPEWDDEPIEVEITEKEERGPSKPRGPKDPKPEMIKVRLSGGNERSIQNMSVTTFMDATGMPITAEEFLKKLYGELPKLFADEKQLREIWSLPLTRQNLLAELAELGFEQEHLNEMRSIIFAEKSDIFDVLSYVRYKAPILTREERVNAAKKQVTIEFDDNQQIFINYILKQYIEQGVEELSLDKINPYLKIVYGSTMDAISNLGSPSEIRNIFINFQKHLYLAEISN
jgi:type I restriction enzyme, R subunit